MSSFYTPAPDAVSKMHATIASAIPDYGSYMLARATDSELDALAQVCFSFSPVDSYLCMPISHILGEDEHSPAPGERIMAASLAAIMYMSTTDGKHFHEFACERSGKPDAIADWLLVRPGLHYLSLRRIGLADLHHPRNIPSYNHMESRLVEAALFGCFNRSLEPTQGHHRELWDRFGLIGYDAVTVDTDFLIGWLSTLQWFGTPVGEAALERIALQQQASIA